MKISRKIIFSFSFLILAALIFGGGFYLGQDQKKCAICQPSEVDFSLFWQAWDKIQQKFVNKDNLDVQKMIYGAISGMVDSLGDPYTVFFPPQEAKMFKEDVKGTFEGVGMEIGVRKGQLRVVSPIEGTPAQRAGLRAGDEILKINGTSTDGLSSDAAASLIRGKKGTQVTLNIFREGWEEAKDFVLTRDVIEVPSLKLEFKVDSKGEKIAYINLYQFSAKANYDFNGAAIDILNSDAKKIVLDLRNNPGGYLEIAQSIAGWFLPAGNVVVVEDFGKGEEAKHEYLANGPSDLAGYPVVVLINGGSASAAEILAGALRDNRGIQLVGEKSFGKGSVQELSDLEGGSSIKITVAKWLTPKGSFITDVGLEPDVKVVMTDEDYNNAKDPQLDKAIEIIEGL
jgi:carboxyl-terminal processing protease